MKIFIIDSRETVGAAYVAELLTAFGLCFHTRCSLQRALLEAEPGNDVLVLPAGCAAPGIEDFLHSGGSAVALLPEPTIENAAGLTRLSEQDNPSRLRFVQPVCRGTRGESLWTQGVVRTYEIDSAAKHEPIAFSFRAGDPTPDAVGITEVAVGGGRLVVYAYDLVQCIVRLRQGHPERANFLPPGQLTPRAAFLQLPNPPPDTFWRPTADLHALAFCEIVKGLVERSAPTPTLWHLPHAAPSILLFSGDEDAAPREADEAEMRDVEAHAAAMNLYVFPGDTSLTKSDVDEFTQRGHTVSVHPYLTDTAGQPASCQIAEAESQVRLFEGKFQRPVRTVRNHSYMWPGYVEIPELWERLGIGMDCNSTSILRGDSPEWGPFAKLNAAMPLRFMREDGSLIDVFQQPTQLNDDLMSHPTSPNSHKFRTGEATAMMERLLDDAVRVDHSPICVNFHPTNYVLFSGNPALALLGRARGLDLPIWSIDRWHDFWRARSSWTMDAYHWGGACLTASFHGTVCEGLTLTLPAEVNGDSLRALLVNGISASFNLVERRGRLVAQLIVAAAVSEVALRAEYGATAPA